MTSHTCPTVLYHVACGEPANLRCSRCQAVWYCCKKHQRLDWKVHKLTCTPVVSSAVNVEPTKAQVDAKGTVSPKAVAMSPPGSPPPVSPTGCAETEFAVQCRGGGYNGGLVDMENSEFVSSSFWKPSHTAYAYELSDDEDDAKAKAPKEAAAPPVVSVACDVPVVPAPTPPPVSPTGCAETEFAVQCRGGGYNGGLVDMENSEFVSSSFWKPSHTAYAYELSDDEDDAKAKAPHEEAAPVVPVVPVAPVAPTEVEKVRRTRHTVAPVPGPSTLAVPTNLAERQACMKAREETLNRSCGIAELVSLRKLNPPRVARLSSQAYPVA